MNEDYLWDKTGSDAEIEKLENALKNFRLQEIAPPKISAEVSPFAERIAKPVEMKPQRSFFRLGFAFAASFFVCALFIGVWLRAGNNGIELAQSSGETIPAKAEETRFAESAAENEFAPPVRTAQKIETVKAPFERNLAKISQKKPAKFRSNKTLAKTDKPAKAETIVLTEEEKYAYDQLMLALSITSSKLKIVKDKVGGLEDQNAVLETER